MSITAPAQSFNLNRKLFHILGFIFPLCLEVKLLAFLEPYIEMPTRSVEVYLLLIGVPTLFLVETVRLSQSKLNSSFKSVFKKLMKDEESDRYISTVAYLTAYLILLLFFSVPIITLSSIFLMISDPFAAYVGTRFGRFRFANRRSFEGFLAFIFASFTCGLIYFSIRTLVFGFHDSFSLVTEQGINTQAWLCLGGGALCAAIAELFSPNFLKGLIDDNFIIPIAGSCGLVCVGYFLSSYPLEKLFAPFF